MVFQSRLPVPKKVASSRPLNRMHSESHLTAAPERTLRPLRSMGQLSSAPDRPLPPLPPRSPLRTPNRPTNRAWGVGGVSSLHDHGVQQNPQYRSPFSSSSSGSRYSQDGEAHNHGRNTMLVQGNSDHAKVEFILRRNSRQTPNLSDLSNILQLRGRLQEMGTTFTPEGEMLTYGDPPVQAEFEQMLRLGTWYDEQWNMFFNPDSATEDATRNLWADLKVLKKMLQNEGISFDDHHKRLDYGTTHPRVIRLSDQYDVLREEWMTKTLQRIPLQHIHPAERSNLPSVVEEDIPTTPTNLGWNFLFDEDEVGDRDRRHNRRNSRLTITVDEREPSNGSEWTARENPWLNNTADQSPPIASGSLPSFRETANEREISPSSREPIIDTRQRGRTVGTLALLHGSSPLQVASTASILLRDADVETYTVSGIDQGNEARRREHSRALDLLIQDEQRREDERRRANFPVSAKDMKENKKLKKSKGVRKWLRTVLGRRKDEG